MNALIPSDQTIDATIERLNSDPEFALKARIWEGRFKLVIGDDSYLFQMHEGKVERIVQEPDLYAEFGFLIAGPAEGWEKIFSVAPEPFYQDVYSAWVHHGFTIEGDLEQFFGFHMAIRRMVQIIREARGAEARV